MLARGTLIALSLAAADATAGTIRGTIRVPSAPRAAIHASNPYPGRAGALPMPMMPARGAVGDAVAYLEQVPAAVESVLAATARVSRLAQKNQSFVPRVVPVAAGGSVAFPNLDPVYHNVFSVSPARRFDLGKYPKGQSRSVRFEKRGLVNVYCDIHSNMEAFVLVLPNHAFAQPDTNGVFRLERIPPGNYRLRVWHPDLGELQRKVEVPAGGEAEIALAY